MNNSVNLWSDVVYDYDTDPGSEPYGRDSRILHPKVTSIEKYSVRNTFYNYLSDENPNQASLDSLYCLDRILSHFKIYDLSNYDFDIRSGYYGDELLGVYFKNENDIILQYKESLKWGNDLLSKVKFTLNLEYGYLAPSVIDKKEAIIKKIKIDSIAIFNEDYFSHLEQDVINYYKNDIKKEIKRGIPIAVVRERKKSDGTSEYLVIDGHHRILAASQYDSDIAVKNQYNVIVLK